MKAEIDGAKWSADLASAIQASFTPDHSLLIEGVKGASLSGGISAIQLNVSYITGPGTYPLGVATGINAGGEGVLYVGAEIARTTPLSGLAGVLKITTRTSKRIAGEFEFTGATDSLLTPSFLGQPDIVVTAGQFDITEPLGLGPLPTGEASFMTADIDAAFWRAGYEWGATGVYPNGSFQGLSTGSYYVSLWAKVALASGGTYKIGTEIGAFVLRDSLLWETVTDDSVGVMTITSLDSMRGRGTFYALVPPSFNATEPLDLENGTFSVVMNSNQQPVANSWLRSGGPRSLRIIRLEQDAYHAQSNLLPAEALFTTGKGAR